MEEPDKDKPKGFEDYLNDFVSNSESLTALDMLTKKAEEAKASARDAVKRYVTGMISTKCTLEFVEEMKKLVPKWSMNLNGLDSGVTNLDYLADVLCLVFLREYYVSHEDDGTLAYQHFFVPGDNYAQGGEFATKFFKDFITIKKLFLLEMKHCEEVKIGYAFKFYKP